jgi:hypothetical protein
MAEETKSVQKMSAEAAQKFAENVLVQWESPSAIRKGFAPDLTDEEFKYFMGRGIALGASPFDKEIFPIKYGDKPAQVVVARALYRRKGQEQENYGGSIIEAVYPGEKFIPNVFDPEKTVHEVNDEGRYAQDTDAKPYGAYFIGFYKDGRKPIYHFVSTKEYMVYVYDKYKKVTRPTENWENKTETMIKKVADSQGHRLMYQGVFKGTVSSDEIGPDANSFENDENAIEAEHREVEDSGDPLMDRIVNKEKPTENNPEKDESVMNSPEPTSPDPTEQAEPELPLEPDQNGDPIQDEPPQERQDGHDWPEWAGTQREAVLRKFRYVKGDLFTKFKEQLAAENIYNGMQLAMKVFEESDFTPALISPAQYEKAVEFINNLGK